VSEGTPQPAPPPADETPETPAVTRQREARRRIVGRWARRALALVTALVAAAFVMFFSIDLGRFPQLRRIAEEQATKYLERPAHIGGLSALISPGDFVLRDVVIEGRNPGDRPFMRVARITFHVQWWSILRTLRHPQIHVNVRLTDWQMVVESWAGGIHNIPKLTPRNPSKGPKRFTTTVDFAFATNGHFIYEDHATPWSVDAPNLNFGLARSTSQNEYVGTARFSGGAVRILGFRPMASSMRTRFVLDGTKVHLRHIDLTTEGMTSHVNGEVDFARWPAQLYNVNAAVDFPTMRGIFFPGESWRLGGAGQFTGVFQYAKDGTRELAGDFTSETAAVNGLAFPDLHGSLVWTNTRFAVSHAESGLLGGRTRFDYGLAPLGSPTGSTATFAADYADVDLFELDRIMNVRGLRLAGRATGNLALEWQNGRFSTTRRGDGHTASAPPPGIALAPETLPAQALRAAPEPRPFDANRRTGPLTVGGDVYYRFDPGGTTFGDTSWTATPLTYIAYQGRMGSDGASLLGFHVTSHDWQESDRLLASIMTAVSGPTGAIDVSGRGTFDGVMTGSFSAPRITGHFTGESLRVWDVTWGRAAADLVIENKYVEIAHSVITGPPGSRIVADGRYALGFRNDEQEEIRAQVHLEHWPLVDLRHAFQLDDWPMEGTIGLADLDLRGRYRTMFGSGTLRIDKGRAWRERFDVATGDLELEGTGLRISRIEMHKGPGIARGAARVGWDGTYAFNADGEGLPVEDLDNFKVPKAPLSGRLEFKASGASEFDHPVYAFEGTIDDLFVGSEGIGSVTARLTVADNVMSIERLAAASGRLQVIGAGTIALDDVSTADLRLRFQETAIDPYLKFVMTNDVSPYTRIVVGGSLTVQGPLGTPDALLVDTTIDDATLTLFDYELQNDGPIHLRFENGAARVASLKLKGSDTNLALSGGADTRARTFDLTAAGDASLSILQLFFKGVTTSGAATLNAALGGSFDAPRLSGDAVITNGRLRPLGSPHSLESINGRITFASNAINLDEMTGRIGNGDVTFGGNIALDGYRLAEYNLTAQGRSMRLRYPEGFSSTVNMDLLLTGPQAAPRLSGTVDVLRVSLIAQGQGTGLLGLAAASGAASVPLSGGPEAEGIPLALAIQVTAPRMAFINTKTAQIEASAELEVLGTFDAPIITGKVDILGGQYIYNGNRYFVREGSIDFPTDRFEPVFDVSAETRPRVSGQTFVVTVRITGTLDRLTPQLSSDPWLPESDVVSLIFGGTPDVLTAERRAYGSSQEQQQRMIQTAGAALLTSPLTSLVGEVVERTGVLDTVQITPILTNETAFQQLNPSARVTLGRRISPRVFLTYSRTLSGPQEEIILLEYDQNDRMSWVLSRNEDRTFALDFRIRYSF
jgi:hypothetical protein